MRKRLSLPPESFRLRAVGGQEEVLVYLLATATDLRLFTGSAEPRLMAACDGIGEHATIIAAVYLPLDEMGGGLVAHELAHATFRVMARRGLTMAANEEIFCEVLGELVREFWCRYYAKEAEWKTAAVALTADSAVRV